MLKTALAWSAAELTLTEYKKNSSYYHDAIKFNFTGTINRAVYTKVVWDLVPPKEQNQVAELYRTKFGDVGFSEIYDALGLPETKTRYSPLESKWAFEYFKKFGTFEYNENNTVSLEELLTKLSSQEAGHYVSL